MRLTRAALVTLPAALTLAACGGQASAPAGSATQLLADAAANLQERSTLGFSFEYVRTRTDRPDDPERYGRGEGALDLAERRGRLRFDLDLGLPSSAGSRVEDPFELRWDRGWIEATIDGEARRLPRDDARATGGLLGRLPDEPEAVISLLGMAQGARRAGEDTLAGERLAVIEFVVDAREAGGLGAPAELSKAATAGMLGERLEMEAWVDEDRLPRVIALTIRLEPVSSGGKLVLPARTVRIAYKLDDFGEPVTGLQFESQAG